MKITHYGRYLTQLCWYAPLLPINCYFVPETDGLTLIDTGLSRNANDILAAAQSIRTPIRRIVLTHAHFDHVGGLERLHSALPTAEVLISVRESRLLTGDFSLDPSEPQSKIRGPFLKVPAPPTRTVAAGDRIGSLQVIAAAGHTPGQIALLDTRDSSLIAGDAFQTQCGLAVAGVLRLGFPFPALATWDRRTALQTAIALLATKPNRLAVGHGPVLERPEPAIEQAVAEARTALL